MSSLISYLKQVKDYAFGKRKAPALTVGQYFIKVERKGYRKDKPYHQIVYYLSSCYQTAKKFSEKIQGHWGIENQLHWVKDVIFAEDTSPIHRVSARKFRSQIG